MEVFDEGFCIGFPGYLQAQRVQRTGSRIVSPISSS